MPIYEYRCDKCGEVHEVFQGFGEGPLDGCPACGGPVVKIISSTSFVLKGSGWYSDGYSGKSNKKPSGPGAPAPGKKEASAA
jgi:putative FmdB family regulatory protein